MAGLVGSISGTSALVFDHMPFGAAAFADVANAARALNSGTLPASLSAVGLSAPNMSVVKGIYVEGEALDYLRNDTLAMTLTDLMGSWTGFSTFIGAEGHSSGTTASDIEGSIDMTELENYGAYSGLNPLNRVSLHSQSLLVTYLYGRDVAAGSNWQLVAPLFLEKMVDEDIAESLGLEQNVTDGAAAGDQLSTVIAYSAIDEGTRIYGDTGISALFNDGNDLGAFATKIGADSSGVSEVVTSDTFENIAALMVNYAGALALSKIEASEEPEWLNGIVYYDSVQGALIVDLSFETWFPVLPNGTGGQPATKEAFVQQLFDDAPVDTDSIQAAYIWFGGEEDDGYELIETVTFDTNGSTNEIPFPVTPDEIGVIFTRHSSGGAHILTPGSYMVIGSDADETIIGGESMDMLLGGDGNDVLVGGEGSDWFDGGSGTNVIWGGAINDDEDNAGGDDDTVDYGRTTTSLTFTIASNGTELYLLVGNDTLYSIEEIVSGSNADHLVVNGVLPDRYYLQIDGNGSNGSGQTIDLGGSTDAGGMYVSIENDRSDVESDTGRIRLNGYGDNVSDVLP